MWIHLCTRVESLIHMSVAVLFKTCDSIIQENKTSLLQALFTDNLVCVFVCVCHAYIYIIIVYLLSVRSVLFVCIYAVLVRL